MHSAIYQGHLRHRRFLPQAHRFSYRIFMMYLDLDELDEVLAVSPFWSSQSWYPARFQRSDFLGDADIPLNQAVVSRIHEETGCWHEGSIRMLANLRYFGFNMNPITCYYCFDRLENLSFFVVEVTFPGGSLPGHEAIISSVKTSSDMVLVGMQEIGEDYARTLHHWRERFLAHLDEVRALGFDESFIRMWHYYLCYCQGGFEERVIGTSQMLLAKPGWRKSVRA